MTDRQWKMEVLRRDCYLCQFCLSKGLWVEATDAHHIIHKTWGKRVRHDLDNGIALCRKCHDMDAGKGKRELLDFCINRMGEKYYELRRGE